MRPCALIAAVAAVLAPVTDAYISKLGFPSIIQPGVPFDVYYEQLASQPRPHSLIFGITEDEGHLYKKEIGSNLFLSAYVEDLLPGGGFNGTLSPHLTIPADFEKGPAIVKVLMTEFSGLYNIAGLRAIFIPVTVGDTTSTERSFGEVFDENFVSWIDPEGQ